MSMELELLASVIGIRFLNPENLGALGVHYAVLYQIINCAAREERRIQLQKSFRPQLASIERRLNFLVNARIGYLDKTAGVAGVILNEAIAKVEHIHSGTPSRNGQLVSR